MKINLSDLETSGQISIMICLYVMAVLSDSLLIESLRDFLFGFHLSVRNRKKAKQIYREQTLKDRITMRYIEPLLKKYKKQFRAYNKLYLAELATLVPQYLSLIIFNAVSGFKSRYLFYVFIAVKTVIFLFLRTQVDSLWRSKYSRRK